MGLLCLFLIAGLPLAFDHVDWAESHTRELFSCLASMRSVVNVRFVTFGGCEEYLLQVHTQLLRVDVLGTKGAPIFFKNCFIKESFAYHKITRLKHTSQRFN